ncbi:hypothetical protein Tco_0755209 [Tanacetum coccineum]
MLTIRRNRSEFEDCRSCDLRCHLKCRVRFWKTHIGLRLSEELSGVHDTINVTNLKKCLADASLHVPLDEIKVDKTPRFVEEPVEIMDCEIKSLKRVGSIFLNETLIYCQLCGI